MKLIAQKLIEIADNHPIVWWLIVTMLFAMFFMLTICCAITVVVLMVACFKMTFVDWMGSFKALCFAIFFAWLTYVLFKLTCFFYPGANF